MSTSDEPKWVQQAILELIKRGEVELVPCDDGVLRYKITRQGVKRIEGVIDSEKDD